jgi:hypothetical protein
MVKSLSASNAVRKIRPPPIAGEEWPGGSAVFHTTCLSGPMLSGSGEVSATLAPFGQRKRGQSAAGDGTGTTSAANEIAIADRRISTGFARTRRPPAASPPN